MSQVSPEEARLIELRTREQSNTDEWHQLRQYRLTGCKLKKVCSCKPTTSTANKVLEFIQSSFKGNSSTDHGKLYEPVARRLLEEKLKMKISDCGFFIHPEYPYIGVSPDGVITDSDYLVEVKCPASLPLEKSLTECIKQKEAPLNKFWKNGEKSMNTNCDYFHQIQGQLEVTNKDVCVFAVFKITKVGEELIHELEYELVFRDQQFWEEKMLPKFQKFFFQLLITRNC